MNNKLFNHSDVATRIYVAPITETYSLNVKSTLLQASGPGGTVPDPINGGDD